MKHAGPAREAGPQRGAPMLAAMNTAPSWITLYDITQEAPPDLLWLALSVLVLLVAVPRLARRLARREGAGAAGIVVLGGVLVGAATALSAWDHHRLQAALRDGRVQVAEGPLLSHEVQERAEYNGSTKRYDRSTAESFYVGEVPFGFVRRGSVPGYTNAGATPLVFTPGERLRVHYVEDAPGDFASRRIVRLERVRRPGQA